MLVVLLGTMLILAVRQQKLVKLHKMAGDPLFLLNLLVIALFTIWVLYFRRPRYAKDDKDRVYRMRLSKAVYYGLHAVIIALCASVDLVLLPFWVVWVSSYYFNIAG